MLQICLILDFQLLLLLLVTNPAGHLCFQIGSDTSEIFSLYSTFDMLTWPEPWISTTTTLTLESPSNFACDTIVWKCQVSSTVLPSFIKVEFYHLKSTTGISMLLVPSMDVTGMFPLGFFVHH